MNQTLINSIKRKLDIDQLRDVATHGADTGWPGFCYYHETAAFYARHKKAINQLAEELAADLGDGPLDMVRGFNCLKDSGFTTVEVAKTMYGRRTEKEKNNLVQIDNALAWFALEEVARHLTDN